MESIIERASFLFENIDSSSKGIGAAYWKCNYLTNKAKIIHCTNPLFKGKEISLDESLLGKVVRTKEVLFKNNFNNWEDKASIFKKQNINSYIKNVIEAPIVHDDKVLGVLAITVSTFGDKIFSEDDKPVLTRFATMISIVMQNSFLLKSERLQIEKGEKLRKSFENISTNLKFEDVPNRILNELKKIIEFNRATFQLIENSERTIIAKVGYSDNHIDESLLKPIVNDDLILEVIEGKKPYVVEDTSLNPMWKPHDSTKDIKSWIGIPLFHRNDLIGIITLDHETPNFYKFFDADYLIPFVLQSANVFQNAKLLDSHIKKTNELKETQDYLEIVLTHLQSHQSLATIGLVFGETIHYAKSNLGLVKTLADNIIRGHHGKVNEDIKKELMKIITYIDDYLKIWIDTQNRAIGSPEPVEIDLVKLLDNVILAKKRKSNITFFQNYKFKDPAPKIIGHENQLRQVFLVIVQNAIDAIGMSKGRIIINIYEKKSNSENRFFISIGDTGSGIPEDIQKQLFQLKLKNDVKSKKKSKGSGLGLVWARSFMRYKWRRYYI